MGTRHEDQPAEHWAGAESLDPTPVWKQYLVVAVLVLLGLVIVVVVAVAAALPQLVTPPALVPGDRLVLATSDVPGVGAPPRRVAEPLISPDRAFWLSQPEKGRVLALRAAWAATPGSTSCPVEARGTGSVTFLAVCGAEAQTKTLTFDAVGDPMGTSRRGLDQYLVSVSGDRVIVNLSRVVEASERTTGPVPTGIPQPQATP